MVYNDLDEAIKMIQNPNYLLIEPMQRCIYEHIGTRKNAMKKFINTIEKYYE